jgi:hypothetical protein
MITPLTLFIAVLEQGAHVSLVEKSLVRQGEVAIDVGSIWVLTPSTGRLNSWVGSRLPRRVELDVCFVQ